MRWIAVACALLACLWVEGATAAPTPRAESAHSGQVTAELTYLFDDSAQDFGQRFTHLHVRVRRADAVLVDAEVQPLCSGCLAWPASGGAVDSSSVSVVDLDRDGEPEVLFDLYTGGAHCCLYTMFFRFAAGTYVRHVHSWGNPGYRLRDLGADAARIWRFYRKAVRRRAYPNGLLPAYLADQYLVGKGTAGWARVRKAVGRRDWSSMVDPRWKNRARYLAAVRRFLVRTGYIR